MTHRIGLLFFVFTVCFIHPAYAQDLDTSAPDASIDAIDDLGAPADDCAPKKKKDPSVWDKALSFGFAFSDGNSNTTVLRARGDISRDYNKNLWDFYVDYGFEEADDGGQGEVETTRNQVLAGSDYKREFSDIWFTGFGTSFRYDEIADIDYRVILNPTIGAHIVKTDDLKFALETGPSYIFEKVGNVSDDYFSPRIANNFEWVISETAKIYQSAEYLFDVSDTDNYIVNAEAGIQTSITELFGLAVLVRTAYDNQPAEDRERNDVAVITSLRVNL